MVIRVAGVAMFGISLLVTACGGQNGSTSHTGSPSAPTAATSTTVAAAPATPAASSEDQIRDVLTQESQAFGAFDFDAVAGLTCAKFRDQARDAGSAIPPMSTFPAAAASSMGAQAFADQIGAQFGGASSESLLAVADAVIKQDEPAYKTAMLDVVKQSMTFQLVEVDDIVVTGDTATANATVTQRVGGKPPDTRTSPANFVLEDGQWKDCTPPAQ
jgi:hypothetical protein